jgi:hypothetical protein
MPEEVKVSIRVTKSPIFLSTHYLQDEDTKAKDVGFHREASIRRILRRHIATEKCWQQENFSKNAYED